MFQRLESRMEEFEPIRRLESGMEEFESSLKLGIGNGGVGSKFRHLESGMAEFEPSSDTWNRK